MSRGQDNEYDETAHEEGFGSEDEDDGDDEDAFWAAQEERREQQGRRRVRVRRLLLLCCSAALAAHLRTASASGCAACCCCAVLQCGAGCASAHCERVRHGAWLNKRFSMLARACASQSQACTCVGAWVGS